MNFFKDNKMSRKFTRLYDLAKQRNAYDMCVADTKKSADRMYLIRVYEKYYKMNIVLREKITSKDTTGTNAIIAFVSGFKTAVLASKKELKVSDDLPSYVRLYKLVEQITTMFASYLQPKRVRGQRTTLRTINVGRNTYDAEIEAPVRALWDKINKTLTSMLMKIPSTVVNSPLLVYRFTTIDYLKDIEWLYDTGFVSTKLYLGKEPKEDMFGAILYYFYIQPGVKILCPLEHSVDFNEIIILPGAEIERYGFYEKSDLFIVKKQRPASG